MEEIKNDIENVSVDTENTAAATEAAPEEVIEVVLQDTEDSEDTAEDNAEDTNAEYTAEELSGLTEAQRKRKIIFDKITTALLVLLLISPIAILTYILLWFVFR